MNEAETVRFQSFRHNFESLQYIGDELVDYKKSAVEFSGKSSTQSSLNPLSRLQKEVRHAITTAGRKYFILELGHWP